MNPSKTGLPVKLPRLLLSLAAVVIAFDSCFWRVNAMGFSVSVFVLVLTGFILFNRPTLEWKPRLRIQLGLMTGALVATLIQTGTTNTLVLLGLIIAVAGDTFFVEVESICGRWLSQCVALLFAPGRIFWLAGVLLKSAFREGLGWTGGLIGSCLLALPALVLALIFGSLLASGNAVFGTWTSSFFDWFWKELSLYLDAWRMVLWCFVALIVLPLLRPANVSAWWWSWTQRLPRLPGMIPAHAALFCSGLILAVLNILFLVANFADALFLWSGMHLPSGVTYSGFVHNGVTSLTITVILSALVLTTIFQQELKVAQRRELKVLALLWVTQNLFLLLSVGLRLKLYIEAYDMTVERLSVIIFLILVAAGYALLTIKIVKDRSLSWLIGGCVLAIFATFYITQFLDLGGWSANYNVARWENNRTRTLDLTYLCNLGPSAWPAVRQATDDGADWSQQFKEEGETLSPMNGLRSHESLWPQTQFTLKYWREFSLRAYLNRWALDDKPKN